MTPSRQIQRQPAWIMLASEFGESTLNEKGSGEFDPTFVITKLGAKVNRVVVSGLVERLELRETSNGSQMYQGQLRDPSGLTTSPWANMLLNPCVNLLFNCSTKSTRENQYS